MDEKKVKKLISDATKLIVDKVKNAEKFKIGKTGKTKKQRLSQKDYKDYDDLISIIHDKKNKKAINILESILIKKFLYNSAYTGIIQNKDGDSSGEMSDDDDKYMVYVAVKYKKAKN